MTAETRWTDPDAMAASFQQHASALLSSVGTNLATSCKPDPPAGGFFLAEATADTSVGRVRITYGDREFEISTYVHPSGKPSSLDLMFYLDAMGRDSASVVDSMWVNSRERLDRVLAEHSKGLRACLEALAADPAGLWRAAEDRRLTAMAEFQAKLRRDGLRRASARAADAFRERRLAEVVELLAPYEDILSEGQRRKLNLARDRSIPGP